MEECQMTVQKKGYTDAPATEDNFNIERYINGLTSFIKSL